MRVRVGRLCCTILTVCLLLYGMRLKAYAAPPLLVDEADVLDASQEAELTGALEDISEKYDIDVAVYIVNDLYGKDALDYADDVYVYDEYGTGDDYSGILLLHKPSPVPGETEYAITCDGRVRETISVSEIDGMLDAMADAIVSGRDRGNYLPAYKTFIDLVDRNMMSTSERVFGNLAQLAGGNAILSAIIGFGASFVHMGRQKSKLKSVRRQRSAAAYVCGHGPQLRISNDRLVNRTVTKTPIRRESDNKGSSHSGGRPASVHTHSSGRTLSGGSRRV